MSAASQEAAAPSEEPTIRAGEYYQTRNGRIVGPMAWDAEISVWRDKPDFVRNTGDYWHFNGSRMGHCEDALDLVAFASPAVAPVAVSVKGLTYGQKLIAEAIESHFGERVEDYDEEAWNDTDDTTNHDVWEAFDALSSIIPATKGGELVALKEFAAWVDTWVSNPVGAYSVSALDGLFSMTRDRLAALSAQDTDGVAKREVAWLIERKDYAGYTGPHWYAENEDDGWHWWTPDAADAKRFDTRADAEAFPAYQMIASDPTISVTEHVFLGANP